MNSKSFVLLEHLCDVCGERPFLILDADEACAEGVLADELQGLVSALADEGFVALKYAENGEYCLGVTVQGRSLVNEVRAERERRKQVAQAKAEAEVAAKAEANAEGAACAAAVAEDHTDGQAPTVPAEGDVPRQIEPSLPAASHVGETKTLLIVWLAAFLGALLGGGIVGLVMYILHVILQ